ncbi:MAG: thiamine diphosphokinase [Lentisphaeria bacterium]|nr:thiamine diphosphokinase [Lentisphaeria bacterium]
MNPETAIILADGAFPEAEESLNILRTAGITICCDGAADALLKHGMTPDFIVGDLDSVSAETKARFRERLFHESEQETCDLAKCFRFAARNKIRITHLLGASGKREDHLLGNLAQFAEFSKLFPAMQLVTDYGFFAAVNVNAVFSNVPLGTQLSFFSFDPAQKISVSGVQYPLEERQLLWWYEATLNCSIEPDITVRCSSSTPLLVYFAASPSAGIVSQ